MSIFLGLGSNLGDREMNLVKARDFLMKHDVLVMGQSEVRETKPLGGLDQPNYLNQVVEVHTGLEPEELLHTCKTVEQEMGRPASFTSLGNVQFRVGPSERKWESRVIDIDILFYGDLIMNTPILILPHPGIQDRDFVMAGMRDLAPDFIHPILKKRIVEL